MTEQIYEILLELTEVSNKYTTKETWIALENKQDRLNTLQNGFVSTMILQNMIKYPVQRRKHPGLVYIIKGSWYSRTFPKHYNKLVELGVLKRIGKTHKCVLNPEFNPTVSDSGLEEYSRELSKLRSKMYGDSLEDSNQKYLDQLS
tara:strand:- start:886 stop:1323 length:438 start_codon:yes stop_codon:yes gene_type:complete